MADFRQCGVVQLGGFDDSIAFSLKDNITHCSLFTGSTCIGNTILFQFIYDQIFYLINMNELNRLCFKEVRMS